MQSEYQNLPKMQISLPRREQIDRVSGMWRAEKVHAFGGYWLFGMSGTWRGKQKETWWTPNKNRHIQQISSKTNCIALRGIPGRSNQPRFGKRNSSSEGAIDRAFGEGRQWRVLRCLGRCEEYLHRFDRGDQSGRRYHIQPLPSGTKQSNRARSSRLCILVRNTSSDRSFRKTGRVSTQIPGREQPDDNGATDYLPYGGNSNYCWQGDQE